MTLKFDDKNVPYIDMGQNFRVQLEAGELNETSLLKAETELRETPEIRAQGIKELRQLLEDDKDLHVPLDDEEFLVKFLRPCKFYSKSAYDKIKNFYKFKIKHKKICSDLMPDNLLHVFEQDLLHLQPRRDQHQRRMVILDVGRKWKPSKCSLEDIFRTVQLCLEAAMIEPLTQVNGVVAIFDMEGLSLTHVMQFTPSLACMILDWVQDSIALRLKAVHVVNNSYLFNMIFAIFKPFIREKLRKRIFFHNKDWRSLTSHIDKDCLRPKYGGTMDAPEIHGKFLFDLLKCYDKRFIDSNKLGYEVE